MSDSSTLTGVSSALPASELSARAGNSTSNPPSSTPIPAESTPSSIQEAPPDKATCRMCFGDDSPEEVADLGELIQPCKCNGTARFIHTHCLDSWRKADRKNGFYTCGTCGFRYRLRSTVWTRLATKRVTNPLLSFCIVLVLAVALGFAAPHLMLLAENDNAPQSKPVSVVGRILQVMKNFLFLDVVHIGNALRETVSSLGFFLGDCRWTSLNIPTFMTFPARGEDGSTFAKTTSFRPDVTRCGEVWGHERDDEVVSWAVRAVMHVVGGYATGSLVLLLCSQVALRWFLFTSVLSFISPRWRARLRIRQLEGPPVLTISSLPTMLSWFVYRAKRARVEDRLFHYSQVALVLITVLSCVWTAHFSTLAARWIVKNRVGKVEGVVLDVRDVEGVKKD